MKLYFNNYSFHFLTSFYFKSSPDFEFNKITDVFLCCPSLRFSPESSNPPSGVYNFCTPNLNGGAITEPSIVLDVFFDMMVPTLSSRCNFGLSLPSPSEEVLLSPASPSSAFFSSSARLKALSTSFYALRLASAAYRVSSSFSTGIPMLADICSMISPFCATISSANLFSMNLKCSRGRLKVSSSAVILLSLLPIIFSSSARICSWFSNS